MKAIKIQQFNIFDKTSISAKINGRRYVGSIWQCGMVKCITYLREINSEKQTTLRIKFALENHINHHENFNKPGTVKCPGTKNNLKQNN